jgi:hypothetical protein
LRTLRGRWRDKQRPPPRSPRQDAAERRQQRPISLRQLRTSGLTLQYPQLVPQHLDLDLFLPLRTTPEHDQREQLAATSTRTTEPCPEDDPSPPPTTLPITRPTRGRPRRRTAESELPAPTGSDVGHVGKVPPRGRPRGACQSLVTLANARPSQVATMMLVPAAFAGTTLSSASSSRALSIVRVARGALMSGAGGSEPPCRTCYTKHHSPTRVFQGLVLLKRMSCCSSATAASCGAVVRTTRIRSPNRSRIWRVAAATLEAVRHVSRVHAQRESACESKVEEPHDHPLVPLHPVVLLHLGNPA